VGDDARLSHVGPDGAPRMVDVGGKPETRRVAVARGRVTFSPGVLARVLAGDLPKGAVLDTARLAGVMGAKKTSELIPLCHPLRLTDVDVRFAPAPPDALEIEASATAVDRTGVEMEALVAVTVAALTVYDMTKAVDKAMVVDAVRLIRKEGGKGGAWERPE
jgi:cyclic pyranopterin monophosphate synthase